MKLVDVKPSTHIKSSKDTNYQDPKFKISDIVRISKYRNIFAKRYVPTWSEEALVIKKVKDTVTWSYVISDIKGEEIVGMFYEKHLQKTNQENKLDVKWKGFDSSFNSWIDKNDSVNE